MKIDESMKSGEESAPYLRKITIKYDCRHDI